LPHLAPRVRSRLIRSLAIGVLPCGLADFAIGVFEHTMVFTEREPMFAPFGGCGGIGKEIGTEKSRSAQFREWMSSHLRQEIEHHGHVS
jgi:hypothetical protein